MRFDVDKYFCGVDNVGAKAIVEGYNTLDVV